jgi:hypothetical protein
LEKQDYKKHKEDPKMSISRPIFDLLSTFVLENGTTDCKEA